MKVEGVLTGWQLSIFSVTLQSKELIMQVIDLSGGRLRCIQLTGELLKEKEQVRSNIVVLAREIIASVG